VIETTTTQAPTTTAEVLGTSIVQDTSTTAAPATTAGPNVAGEQIVAPQATSKVLGEQLARTGNDSRQMVFVAGLALLLGGAAIFASDKLATAKK
jgi:hypothetical protein